LPNCPVSAALRRRSRWPGAKAPAQAGRAAFRGGGTRFASMTTVPGGRSGLRAPCAAAARGSHAPERGERARARPALECRATAIDSGLARYAARPRGV